MKKIIKLVLILIFLSYSIAFAGDADQLGYIDGKLVVFKDLPLKEHVSLYQKSKEIYELKKQYFEEYAFNKLLKQVADQAGIDTEEYLRTQVYAKIPPIMNKEVEDYMNRNWKRYTSYKYDTEALKIRIRRGLLDLRKKNKLEEFRRALLKKHDVISSGPDVKEIKIDIEINEMDHKLGPDTAQNRIVIFMDMECPFCEKIFPNLMELKNDYGDTLQLVYKHFPLESHRNAINLALEANCAGEQGLFFEYVKTVHADEDYSRCQDCKEAFFTKFEVNRDMFANCVENEKNIEPIIDSMSSGKKLGVTSVPTIFVNGFPVFGNMSKERLNALIKGEDMFDDD